MKLDIKLAVVQISAFLEICTTAKLGTQSTLKFNGFGDHVRLPNFIPDFSASFGLGIGLGAILSAWTTTGLLPSPAPSVVKRKRLRLLVTNMLPYKVAYTFRTP